MLHQFRKRPPVPGPRVFALNLDDVSLRDLPHRFPIAFAGNSFGRDALPVWLRLQRPLLRLLLRLSLWLFVVSGLIQPCGATPDLRFDVVTFCCVCSNSIMCDAEFQHLNFPSGNGHFVAMSEDTHRAELLANGNILAIYDNSLHMGTMTNGVEFAAQIEQNSESLFTNTGPRPDWIVLNEISGSQWPTNQAYRTWVYDVVHTLRNSYGYSVIVYSPFPTVASNDVSWQAVSSDAYIAVENYLSGEEVQAQNFSVDWCQSQYASSIATYNARGVPTSRLILGEHFGLTVTGTGWGRAGCPAMTGTARSSRERRECSTRGSPVSSVTTGAMTTWP